MKFGQQLKREAIPEWQPHYLNYKTLKKCIKAGMLNMISNMDPSDPTTMLMLNPAAQIEDFMKLLEPEITKVERFFQAQVSAEHLNVTTLESSLSALSLTTSPPSCQPEQLMSQTGAVLQQLQFLETFAHQNEEGIRKILKKFNKLFFTSLSPDSVSENCSFRAKVRETPLVSIRTGANHIRGALLQILQTGPQISKALVARPATLPGHSTIDLATLQQHFHQPLKDTARHFGMCVTVFKRICRACGIKRWPARKVLMVQAKKARLCKRIGISETELARFGQSVDPTGEAMLEQLQQAALDQVPPGKRRIKVWDTLNKRKLTGMAAPLEANIERYLREHPTRELYTGQDLQQSSEPALQPLEVRSELAAAVSSAMRSNTTEERATHEPSEWGEMQGPAPTETTMSDSPSDDHSLREPEWRIGDVEIDLGDVLDPNHKVDLAPWAALL